MCYVTIWKVRFWKRVTSILKKILLKLLIVSSICSTSPPGGNQVDGLPPAASLCQFFQFFLEGPGSLKMILDDVFWCPGAPGTFLEWFRMNLRSIIFSSFFSEFSAQWVNLVRSFNLSNLPCPKPGHQTQQTRLNDKKIIYKNRHK